MELDAVIKAMEANDGQTKTAAAVPVGKSQLNAALEKAAGVPVAQVDAVDVLMKTANELAGTEKEADISHAALCGQAFADGAIAKLAAYDVQVQRAALEEEKVAMAFQPVQTPGAGMSKIAAASMEFSDDDVVKIASEVGYAATQDLMAQDQGMSKEAAASMEFSDDDVVKIASEVGYAATQDLMVQDQGMSKIAAASMEFSDDDVVKIASEVGYASTQEKIAADYNAGHDDALQEVHNVAATEFLKGAAETETLLGMIEQQRG